MFFSNGDRITARTFNLMAYGILYSVILSIFLICIVVDHFHRIKALEAKVKALELAQEWNNQPSTSMTNWIIKPSQSSK